jgi:predicted membrane channel-forming protein YqfA (hemolysin III family)
MVTDRYRRVAWGGAAVVAFGVIGGLIAAGGWPGEPSGCIAAGDCSCEAFSAGIILQPINTLSSLALIATGLWLVWRVPIGAVDRLRRLIYAATVVGLGIGSAAFHASATQWGGWADLLGIHVFLGTILVIELAVLGDRTDRWVARTVVIGGAAGGIVLWFLDNGLGKYTAGALIVAIGVAEWRIRQHALRPSRRWLWWAVGLFGVGLGLQWLGRGGGPWCEPDAVFQPHAMWHIVAAAAAIVLSRYLFARSQPRNA